MPPSPVCEFKDGAAAYAATTYGGDITASNTIIIRLADVTDVKQWTIFCLTTDDLGDKDTLNAGLVVDAVAKTATFTAPAGLGRTLRFYSRVNNGLDENNVPQSSYETTFCLYTLTAGGDRTVAVDETVEQDPDFGWIVGYNALIRAGGGGGGSPTGAANTVQTTDGAGNHAAATNVLAGSGYISIGASPSGTGAVRLANNVAVSGNGGGSDRELIKINASNIVYIGNAVTDTEVDGAAVRIREAGTTIATFDAGSLAFGASTFATEGLIRATNAGFDIFTRNSGDTDNLCVMDTSATELFFGTNSAYGKQFSTLRAYFSSALYFGQAGVTTFGWDTSSKFFANDSVSLGSSVAYYGGGDHVVFIGPAVTDPSSDPTNGTILWSDDSDEDKLKTRGSNGDITHLDGSFYSTDKTEHDPTTATKFRARSYVRQVQTTTDANQEVDSGGTFDGLDMTLADDGITTVTVEAWVSRSSGAVGYAYVLLKASYRRDAAGDPTLVGSVDKTIDQEGTIITDVSLVIDTTNEQIEFWADPNGAIQLEWVFERTHKHGTQ